MAASSFFGTGQISINTKEKYKLAVFHFFPGERRRSINYPKNLISVINPLITTSGKNARLGLRSLLSYCWQGAGVSQVLLLYVVRRHLPYFGPKGFDFSHFAQTREDKRPR